jgi:hypothetical protein
MQQNKNSTTTKQDRGSVVSKYISVYWKKKTLRSWISSIKKFGYKSNNDVINHQRNDTPITNTFLTTHDHSTTMQTPFQRPHHACITQNPTTSTHKDLETTKASTTVALELYPASDWAEG